MPLNEGCGWGKGETRRDSARKRVATWREHGLKQASLLFVRSSFSSRVAYTIFFPVYFGLEFGSQSVRFGSAGGEGGQLSCLDPFSSPVSSGTVGGEQ